MLPQANGVLETLSRKLALGVINTGGVAGSSTRTDSLARSHSAVKSQPRKLKGPGGSYRRPPGLPFQQRTNTSCYLIEIPTHGFTVVLSVFRGTPPAKPLNCKSVSNRLGARIRPAWTHHTGGTFLRSCASIRLALSDITRTSLFYGSQTLHLSFGHSARFRETKNPAYFAVSRVREILYRSSKPAYTGSIQITFRLLP